MHSYWQALWLQQSLSQVLTEARCSPYSCCFQQVSAVRVKQSCQWPGREGGGLPCKCYLVRVEWKPGGRRQTVCWPRAREAASKNWLFTEAPEKRPGFQTWRGEDTELGEPGTWRKQNLSGERGKSKSRGGSPCPLPLLITSSRETQRDKKESQTAGERESPSGQEGQRGTRARQGTGATDGETEQSPV